MRRLPALTPVLAAAVCATSIAITTAVSATSIAVYFSPHDHPEQAVVQAFDHARDQILAVIYDFTDARIAGALLGAARRGVQVWVVMDASEAGTRSSQYSQLAQALGTHLALRSGRGSRHAIVHDKFAVIDSHLVLTGSFNWTHLADCCNRENLLALDDPALARLYGQEFRHIWDDHWP